MTDQEKLLSAAFRQLPDPITYKDDWCIVRFNSESAKGNGFLKVDQNYIENFNNALPCEVQFKKVISNGSPEWQIVNEDFTDMDNK